MATTATTFVDLPDDALLAILSFLPAGDAISAVLSSRRLASSFSSSPLLPLSLLLRLHPHLQFSLPVGPTPTPLSYSRRLFRSVSSWSRLLGFWRVSGPHNHRSLISFRWGPPPCTLVACHVSASAESPFLRFHISETGESVGILMSDNNNNGGDAVVGVRVNFVGEDRIIVEEEECFEKVEEVVLGIENSSPPDRVVEEIYAHFANRVDGRNKRGRRRRGRGRGSRLEPEHFVRIPHWRPTAARPLQGLWKVWSNLP